jgi:rhamnosyltransferase
MARANPHESFAAGGGLATRVQDLHRYALASAIVEGAVLDLGRSSGHGACLLARSARRVVGVDLSPPLVGSTRVEFALPSLDHLVAAAEALPFRSATFDWIVSFGTIDRARGNEGVLAEMARVLVPGGRVLLCAPRRPVRREAADGADPFDARGFDPDELRALLAAHFGGVVLFGQRLVAGSVVWDLGPGAPPLSLDTFPPDSGLGSEPLDLRPTYLLALCGPPTARRPRPAYASLLAGGGEVLVEVAEREGREAELRQALERARADLDWCYQQWQAREAELGAIRRSRTWRLRTATRALAGRGWRRARASFRAPTRAIGCLYLASWTAGALLGARWRRRAGVPSEEEPPDSTRVVFSGRPRILIVCPYPLYPAHHGGGVRIYNLLRRLCRHCDLHLLTFIREDDEQEQRRVLQPWVKKLYFHHWQPRLREDRWGLTPRAAQLFQAPEVSALVNEILARERIDILQLEYTEMGQYGLPRFARVKVVLSEIDITFRSRARRRRAGMYRRYAEDRLFGDSLVDWMRQFRYELQVARRADQVHVMSNADAAYLARFVPGGPRKIRAVPNAVDVDVFQPPAESGGRGRHLLFVGNFQHLPNLDALDYLLGAVWPLIRRRAPAAELVVVGAQGGEPVQRHHGRDGVTVVGTVAEVAPYYQRCRTLVAPIRAGSGTRLKILEALACATPVVTTTVGAEGIEGVPGQHFLIADTAADLVHALCRLLEDDDLCRRLGRAGRELVERRYSWDRSADAAVAGYASLLERAVPSVGASPEPRAPVAAVDPTPPAVDISVVIPTLHGGAVFERCLAAVTGQRTQRSVEVVCVDSGSSAADLATMERYGARVISIARAEFNHGLTRDLGAAASRGRVLVFINQDAVPRDEDWLEGLTAPLFAEDGCVAVQGGMSEVPERDQRFYWDSCGDRFYFTRESKRWMERYFGIGFSTVNAAIRREAWERHPFGDAQIMEDKKWQREVVAAGHGIAVAPGAVVYHTHNYDMRSLLRRCRSEGFGWRMVGQTYSLYDMLADMLRPRMCADLLRGLTHGQIRSWAELLFPWLRPLMVYAGNRWGQGIRH